MAKDVWRIGLRDSKDRIWVDFPYRDDVKALLQDRVAGLRYDKKAGFFHAPLDMETARDLHSVAKYYGGKLKISADLVAWITQEKIRQASIIKPDDFNSDVSSWLPKCRAEKPQIIAAMEEQKHQIPGTAFMVNQPAILLADDPGAGKTLQTLAAIYERDIRGPVLIVAPRTAVNVTWPEEIEKWLGEDEVYFKITGTMSPEERAITVRAVREHSVARPQDRVWVLCGPNYLRIEADLDDYGNYVKDSKGHKIVRVVNEGLADLFRIEWACVVVDECHETLATAKGNPKKQSAQRQGFSALTLRKDAFVVAISGTPFRGKTENIWGILNFLYPSKYTSFWNWARRHYGVKSTGSRFGSGIGIGDRILDEKRFHKELQPYMVRRTKAEIAPWLPAKKYGGSHLKIATGERHMSEVPPQLRGEARMEWMTREFGPIAVWLPMDEAQKKQYEEIEKKALLTISDMGDQININGVLAEMTRCKQIANSCLKAGTTGSGVVPRLPSNKIDWIEDFLKDRIEAGTKTIVASQFTSFIELMSQHLTRKGIKHFSLTGKTSDAERTYIKNTFQSDNSEEMVILINTKAGGTSITLDAADDVIICDQTWIPDAQQQVEDRAHRISRNHNVTIWYLCSLGTVDEDVAITNTDRETTARSVLDKQRGVSYVKTVVDLIKKRNNVAA